MVTPPQSHPVVIRGSANWTDSVLASTDQNVENVVVLRHKNIARIFYAQFKWMTGLWTNREDFWCDIIRTNGSLQAGLWMTDTNGFILQRSVALCESVLG